MIDILRKDMIEAFQKYMKKPPMQREIEWEFYCKCRENFLKERATLTHTAYVPLKLTLEKTERYEGN